MQFTNAFLLSILALATSAAAVPAAVPEELKHVKSGKHGHTDSLKSGHSHKSGHTNSLKSGNSDELNSANSDDLDSGSSKKITYLAKPELVAEELTYSDSKKSGHSKHDKRGFPIAIVLAKVIGGKIIAGAATAGVEVAKEHLNPQAEDWKDFGEARRHFTPEMAKDIYDKKGDGNIKGVACFNMGYTTYGNVLGPANIKFKWDMYNVDFDCFEMYPGAFIHNNGDGGYENIAYYGVCRAMDGGYRC